MSSVDHGSYKMSYRSRGVVYIIGGGVAYHALLFGECPKL